MSNSTGVGDFPDPPSNLTAAEQPSLTSVPTSVLDDLAAALPELRSQIYFKSSLTALSHAMEDLVLAARDEPLVVANFQQERFYRQEAYRYRRLAEKTPHVYVLSAPETDFGRQAQACETIAFAPDDPLTREWHLAILSPTYAACLICRECPSDAAGEPLDDVRQFEGFWTFDRRTSMFAAEILLRRIQIYRPDLERKIAEARSRYLNEDSAAIAETQSEAHPFIERLVTHLQAGQYKLIRAYRSLATKERQEHLLRTIGTALRQSLDPDTVLQVAARELGKALQAERCFIYRDRGGTSVRESKEYVSAGTLPFADRAEWQQQHPLLTQVGQAGATLAIDDIFSDARVPQPLPAIVREAGVRSWLLVPIRARDRTLGTIEVHRCGTSQLTGWTPDAVELVEAIAVQVGAALVQADAYSHLEDLNQQLAALDRTRSNLVAIAGHELRTPLSTIQVCLESLYHEPEMSLELQQVMLNTALQDTERMRKLVQDFLTLSQFESGRVSWHPEPISLQECIDLSLSSVRARGEEGLPQIFTPEASNLPLVEVDGEWLVEVLAKLLDNACKFTGTDGEISLSAQANGDRTVKVTIADTGRGIEPDRLEQVFERFYQEEGALRRTQGGTGLGLAICRQIVRKWGGQIWAESAGKNSGTRFHFTLPIARPECEMTEARPFQI